MSLNTNFNVSPYYDDYDENKKFHRVLFKPAVALQARELTQLQTILQKQVKDLVIIFTKKVLLLKVVLFN